MGESRELSVLCDQEAAHLRLRKSGLSADVPNQLGLLQALLVFIRVEPHQLWSEGLIIITVTMENP